MQQFTSAKNHWISPMHSNVTSKIVVGFTLRGPPCTTWFKKSPHRTFAHFTSPNVNRFLEVCHRQISWLQRFASLHYSDVTISVKYTFDGIGVKVVGNGLLFLFVADNNKMSSTINRLAHLSSCAPLKILCQHRVATVDFSNVIEPRWTACHTPDNFIIPPPTRSVNGGILFFNKSFFLFFLSLPNVRGRSTDRQPL